MEITQELAVELDACGRALLAVRPWECVPERTVLRIDSRSHGMEGACVLLDPGLEGFALVSHPGNEPEWLLFLRYVPIRDLPPSMRKELLATGARPDDLFPVPSREEVGNPALHPVSSADARALIASANALGAVFVKYGASFRDPQFAVSETFTYGNDLAVRLTFPYEMYERFAPEPKVGRNEPCPCGSGKKYKKCHLAQDEAKERSPMEDVHEMDRDLVQEIGCWALERFGVGWDDAAANAFGDADADRQLFEPWCVYHTKRKNLRIADLFAASARGFSPMQERWLEAQRAAWLSVWEVTDVDADSATIQLRDLLTGESRCVIEKRGSASLARRDCLLGRIVDWDGRSLLAGSHLRCLGPRDAAGVVQEVRRKLRLRGIVPAERLQSVSIGAVMIGAWEEKVEARAARAAGPIILKNTDGDDLLLTRDHFDFAKGTSAELYGRLMALAEVDADGDDALVFMRFDRLPPGWDNVHVGRLVFVAGGVVAEANSIARADAMRKRLDELCPGTLRHKMRDHTDPSSTIGKGMTRPRRQSSPDEAEMLRVLKSRHYEAWLDHPLPALEGKTPRQACRTPKGRAEVDLLLREIENHEARLPAAERFDLAGLRTALSLQQVLTKKGVKRATTYHSK